MNHPQTETTFRFWGWVLMAIAWPLGLALQASVWVEDRALSPATAMGQEPAQARQPAVEFSAKKIASAHLENLHHIELKPAQASANQQAVNKQAIWFGGSPETEAAMAELAASGVKTIVSVDGAPPLVELAKNMASNTSISRSSTRLSRATRSFRSPQCCSEIASRSMSIAITANIAGRQHSSRHSSAP